MKTWKTRIMSALLVIMTLLTLLPTSALAASSTGTGIKPTSNTNYWTTRLLHDGTPYSYKPPMAAGKMLYCLDRGYGYRWGTASFLNSYTYTSATGADADTVLKTALAQSGMGELDAQQLENFKWMMTFIVDYKGDVPGSLFMAAQTYDLCDWRLSRKLPAFPIGMLPGTSKHDEGRCGHHHRRLRRRVVWRQPRR